MKKGISLITLVITIIIMSIIAGAIIISLSNTGIFNKANKATFTSDVKAILEEYNIYQAFYMADGKDISSLNVEPSKIHEVVTSIPNNWSYKEKIAIVNGQITYLVNLKDKEDVERAVWACEAGMKVDGVEGCSDIEYIEPEYRKHGGIYYNVPDLTGFNPEKTFYVTYNDDTEVKGDSISNKPPENWYDYEHQKWANIVVINGELKTYLVWIPRYVYKLDAEGKEVKIRFVDNDNVYIDEFGNKVIYDENQTEYALSNAFDINMGSEEEQSIRRLSGFWISKYEVQEEASEQAILGTNFIDITLTNGGGEKYDYYINGVLDGSDKGKTYKYEGLEPDKAYTLKIVAKNSNGNEVGTYTCEYTTLGNNTKGITGFNMDTYSDKIVVYSTTLTDLAKQNNVKIYEFYKNGEKVAENDTGIYTFDELDVATIYEITIKLKDTGIYYGEYTRTLTTTGVPEYGEANAPELGALLKAGTYYLTWNENGQESKIPVVDGNGNPVAPPENWYNYKNKEWANILVINEELQSETHLTWIPRYEYKVFGAESSNKEDKRVDISFIPATQLEPTKGYLIPESFDLNMGDGVTPKHLTGFWISKYEVQEVATSN